MEEIWKDIDGFEGLYQVSNLGNVKSLNYGKHGYSKNLLPKENCKGYLWVILHNGETRKCALIHRLVGEAFIPNPSKLPFINHKDENPHNNIAENLEWCTGSYNVLYSLGLHPERLKKSGCLKRKRKSGVPYKHKKEVIQYSKYGEEINRYQNVLTVCSKTKWTASSIIECCNGKRKTAYGYIWRFVS